MLVAAKDFWPLKLALLEYVVHCFMDSADPGFLSRSVDDEESAEQENGDEEDQGESDV